MQNLCACLCNQAGHTGVCRGSAESGLRLAPGQPSIVDGPVCRGCFEAVRPLSTRYGPVASSAGLRVPQHQGDHRGRPRAVQGGDRSSHQPSANHHSTNHHSSHHQRGARSTHEQCE